MTPRTYWGRNNSVLFEWRDTRHRTLWVLWSETGFLEGCSISWESAVKYNGPLIGAV